MYDRVKLNLPRTKNWCEGLTFEPLGEDQDPHDRLPCGKVASTGEALPQDDERCRERPSSPEKTEVSPARRKGEEIVSQYALCQNKQKYLESIGTCAGRLALGPAPPGCGKTRVLTRAAIFACSTALSPCFGGEHIHLSFCLDTSDRIPVQGESDNCLVRLSQSPVRLALIKRIDVVIGKTVDYMGTKISVEGDYSIWTEEQLIVLVSRVRSLDRIQFVGSVKEVVNVFRTILAKDQRVSAMRLQEQCHDDRTTDLQN